MRDLLITGAQLADGTSADLGVSNGHFVAPSDVTDAERIDADGLLALPGLVDPHTHLREPGREDAETIATGTLAAARGGYTAVHAMANLDPVTDTAEAAEYLAALAARTANAEVIVSLESASTVTSHPDVMSFHPSAGSAPTEPPSTATASRPPSALAAT